PDLSLDVITNDGEPAFTEPGFPSRIASDEDRHAIHDADACRQGTFHVEFSRPLRSNRKEVQQNLRARYLKRLHDLVLGGIRTLGLVEATRTRARHVRRHTIEDAHANVLGACASDVRVEDCGVVRSGKYGDSEFQPDLPRVDVDAKHKVDISSP